MSGWEKFQKQKIKNKKIGGGRGWASEHIFWNLKGYCIALAKPRRQALSTSFYNNIVNHETNEFFKNIYSMLTI